VLPETYLPAAAASRLLPPVSTHGYLGLIPEFQRAIMSMQKPLAKPSFMKPNEASLEEVDVRTGRGEAEAAI